MRKYLRRRLPTHQIIVTIVVGVLGGAYIWKPIIQKFAVEHPEVEKEDCSAQSDSVSYRTTSNTKNIQQ